MYCQIIIIMHKHFRDRRPPLVPSLEETMTLGPQLKNPKTDLTFTNYLFRSVKLAENADSDKYKYNGYDVRFDSRSQFSFTDGSYGKNVIIFGVDMSSSHLCMLIIGKRDLNSWWKTNTRIKSYVNSRSKISY